MSKRTKHLTAAAAKDLADGYDAHGPSGPAEQPATVRPDVVKSLVKHYLDAVERKARVGSRRLLWHEAATRGMYYRGEIEAVRDQLRTLGYTVDERGVRW